MPLISVVQLRAIAPQAEETVIAGLIDPLNKYLVQYEINTLLRWDHFFSQSAEETAGFRTLTEYASGQEYEGRKDLGNVNPGDGVRFKGRGIFQITGRYNYQHYGNILGVDLVASPSLAATPEIAVRTALEFWKAHNLNELADNDDIEAITRKINGGLNGLSDREIYCDRADDAFTPLFS
jgi:putative chitinase